MTDSDWSKITERAAMAYLGATVLQHGSTETERRARRMTAALSALGVRELVEAAETMVKTPAGERVGKPWANLRAALARLKGEEVLRAEVERLKVALEVSEARFRVRRLNATSKGE